MSIACKNSVALSYENGIHAQSAIPKKRLTIRRYAVILNIVHIGVMR